MTTTNKVADEEQLVEGSLPLRLTSIVVKGFGRGSTDLGIPTANLSRDGIKILKKSLANASFDDLPTGMLEITTFVFSFFSLSFCTLQTKVKM
jgi:FAD synthase